MRKNVETALNSAAGEQVTKVVGAVWTYSLHLTGEEEMVIQTPERRVVATSLKPSDVYDPICALAYPTMRAVHDDK